MPVDYNQFSNSAGWWGKELQPVSSIDAGSIHPSPVTSSAVTHIVQRGDTLSTLAEHFGTTVNELVKVNKIKNSNLIYVGQVLTIPSPAWHKTNATEFENSSVKE